jgi:electron transport complex protein RnfB
MNTKQQLINAINEILPQTQCTRCGYPSCLDYAQAIADNKAQINQCPPGGNQGIVKLAAITSKPIEPLNPENGIIKDKTIVVIDEDVCIGCTLCIKACPVDAIIGSNKMLHTIIADECTGCDLCIPACPVDCIHVIADPNLEWSSKRANHAKMRYQSRNNRLKRDKDEREARLNMRLAKIDSKISINSDKRLVKDNLSTILGDIITKANNND